MKITIIIPEKKIPPYYKAAISEYSKRLSRYCKIGLIQCKSLEELIKKTPITDYIIGVTPLEDSMTSENLANKISDYGIRGDSAISFVFIHHCSLLSRWDEMISLSSMTMSTGLSTVMLYEQIYRAYRILNNQAYHK